MHGIPPALIAGIVVLGVLLAIAAATLIALIKEGAAQDQPQAKFRIELPGPCPPGMCAGQAACPDKLCPGHPCQQRKGGQA